jgi:hypothetical protein
MSTPLPSPGHSHHEMYYFQRTPDDADDADDADDEYYDQLPPKKRRRAVRKSNGPKSSKVEMQDVRIKTTSQKDRGRKPAATSRKTLSNLPKMRKICQTRKLLVNELFITADKVILSDSEGSNGEEPLWWMWWTWSICGIGNAQC